MRSDTGAQVEKAITLQVAGAQSRDVGKGVARLLQPSAMREIMIPHTAKMLAQDVELETLADRTENYTGADLENLARRAGLEAHYRRMAAELKQESIRTRRIGFAPAGETER